MAAQVLLVDDDATVLQTLADVFRVGQFEVATASSGREAVTILAERDFDLVVTDMRMETPQAGYDVVKAAKAHPSRPVTVILSAYPIPMPEWKGSGADAMFLKGAGVARMLDQINDILSKRAKPAARSTEENQHGKRAG